jgi:hypothetical protein
MAYLFRLRCTVRSAAVRLALPSVLLALLLASTTLATSVTYTAVTITDGQLGSWKFQNARVYLTFDTDTMYVQQTQIGGVDVAYVGPFPPQQLCTGTPSSVGTARAIIISGQKKVEATFAPNQIFVSLDQDNGGVGFGSCDSNGGFEPAYPIGIDGGTIFGRVYSSLVNANAELAALPIDLVHNAAFSGRAWICVGFPTNGAPCSSPNPLQTDKGALLLSQPYQQVSPGPPISYGDTLHGGVFTAIVDGTNDGGATFPILSGSAPITYNAVLVSDVSIGERYLSGALVYISFAADPKNVIPLPNAHGSMNKIGNAKVRIVASNATISTQIFPHQLYAYFDSDNTTAGFGSLIVGGAPGYPLGFTATEPPDSIYGFEHSTLGAVADLIRTSGADSPLYLPLTLTLVTNPLTNPTMLSGNVSSCPGTNTLAPSTAICSNLSPIALSTGLGKLFLYEVYTGDVTGTGTQPYSTNFGIFWSEAGESED